MANPGLHEITKQASFFFKEKIIKSARLAVTNVTAEELLTEEVTSNNSSPNVQSMAIIRRASFEVDQFQRIVKILRRRLLKFDRKDWRATYNTLILLNHLLVHGPVSVAREFQHEREVIEEVMHFQCIDEKGFDWGLKARNLSERVMRLLEDETLLKQERERIRKLTFGKIVGYGDSSFKQNSSHRFDSHERDYGRSLSLFNDLQARKNNDSKNDLQDEKVSEEEHPFVQNELENAESLLLSPTRE